MPERAPASRSGSHPKPTSASCHGVPRDERRGAALPSELARARALTNCSLTRARLKAFRSLVRSRAPLPAPGLAAATASAGAAGVPTRILLVQRGGTTRGSALGAGATRVLLDELPFVRRLRESLGARLARRVEVRVADFSSDLARNAALLDGHAALVAVHGNALTNLLLAARRGTLRAAVQLLPTCLPEGTLSNHAYEVLGHLVLGGRFRSVCCLCATPTLGKTSHVTCNATRVASALAGLLLV